MRQVHFGHARQFLWCPLLLMMRADSGREPGATFTDPRDGRTYATVTIGDLHWFTQNLAYVTPRSVCYDHLEPLCTTYGRLYPFDEAHTACPSPWRLPEPAEVDRLHTFLRSRRIDRLAPPGAWQVRGGQRFTNSSGLSVLPAGRIDPFSVYSRTDERWLDTIDFHQLGTAASFWLLDEGTEEGVMHWHLGQPMGERRSGMHRHAIHPDEHKFSIRCVCERISTP